MEGVGARLGRSSTRYGPTTVFSGPVRKWKKKWVHVSPPNASSSHHSQTTINGSTNGNNGSHLLFFKWTPISQSQNNNNGNNHDGDTKSSAKDDVAATSTATEERPRRKFKYIPIAVLEEQNNEAAEEVEDEAKPSETDPAEPTSNSDGFDEKPDINDVPMEESQIGTLEKHKNGAVERLVDEAKPSETDPDPAEPTSKSDGFDEKPDINDVPMEESQDLDNNPLARQDLNESLDLSLGLKAHDGDNDNDSRTDQIKDGQLERLNSGSAET